MAASQSSLEKFEPIWVADQGDGTYRNPILHADYSDPDVIRVGDDFYMTASSFSHTPGLPILHSKDLVNWKLVNYAIERLDIPGYDVPLHGKGVWAPSIRYHDNKYWIFFSTPDEGIYVTTATHPEGQWSPLHLVHEVKGWIDPCPLWDDDGQAYLVHAFANSRCGIKSKIQVCRMAPDGSRLLDEGRIVFDGTEHHPTIEGPKFYKRDGDYYIFAPAGGVKPGWQTVLRSKQVFGPYEDRIVMHQGSSTINGPHQGGYVELDSGESWFIHFQDRDAYGRIVHLQPMQWDEQGWPIIGLDQEGDGTGEPVILHKKPNVGSTHPVVVPEVSDDFRADRLGLQWQWQANAQPEWADLNPEQGLILHTLPYPDGVQSLFGVPQLLMQKLPASAFEATTQLTFHPKQAGDQAGLLLFGDAYAYLYLTQTEDGAIRLSLNRGEKQKNSDLHADEWQEEGLDWKGEGSTASGWTIHLRLTLIEPAHVQFSWSEDGVSYTPIGTTFVATTALWVGAKMGLFAINTKSEPSEGKGKYRYFAVKEIQE
ncbi:glycoside hydrolase 43 family protein [Paenibacillus sp. MER 99-2]|uniref:glycoside hydrolase family 43 protein n=1 Tax=Paenibacillus sp. MER 99-2 TaxID=2939572 RepID=UPI00203A9839|nr:glycoside hydrolase 43 family protein [Paenibacillus sp. MER 99-2]MCM3175173.1 glycoside hydrolase 43 family protein [Paenibacillus sp. MER 99-2]